MMKTTPTSFIMGFVTQCNMSDFTVDISLSHGRALQGVPLLNLYGSILSKDLCWLQSFHGANVILIKIQNEYFVLSALPSLCTEYNSEANVPITQEGEGGATKDTYRKARFTDYRNNRADDIYPEDKVIRVDNGVELSLWREGVVKLKASPLAQFILGKYKDFGRLITRTFIHYTDFGEVNFKHDPTGRVGMSVKGGAEFIEETHPSKAKWTIQAYAGDCPNSEEARLYVKVNDKDENNVVTLSVDIEGNIDVMATNTFNALYMGDEKVVVNKDAAKTVLEDCSETVLGTKNVNVKKAINITSLKEVIINAPSIKLNGPVSIDGTLAVQDHATFAGGTSGDQT